MSTIKLWVARDKDGELNLYLAKPIRFNNSNGWEKDCWDTDDEYLHIDPSLFPNLKWEDEPFQVELNDLGLPSIDQIENVLTCIAEYYADVFRNGVQPEEFRREQAQMIREYITMYYDYWLPMNERGVELPRTKSNEQDEEEVQTMKSN